jgi:hypothetical protein
MLRSSALARSSPLAGALTPPFGALAGDNRQQHAVAQDDDAALAA